MLTLEELEKMEYGHILGGGTIRDDRLWRLGAVKWIAVRGQAPDWAIYFLQDHKSFDQVLREGDKVVFNKELIRELVPCTDEVFERYRY